MGRINKDTDCSSMIFMNSVFSITKATVRNNPAPLTEPFGIDIEYECFSSLPEDLECKIIYVGSSEDIRFDQESEKVHIEPIMQGSYRIELKAAPPDTSLIPRDELVGASAILLKCSYKNQEFIRVGYFVNIDFSDDDERYRFDTSVDHLPNPELLVRNILADEPRITRFPIEV